MLNVNYIICEDRSHFPRYEETTAEAMKKVSPEVISKIEEFHGELEKHGLCFYENSTEYVYHPVVRSEDNYYPHNNKTKHCNHNGCIIIDAPIARVDDNTSVMVAMLCFIIVIVRIMVVL